MNKMIKMIHLTAGLIGSLLVLIMSVTGILLNHRTIIGYTNLQIQQYIFGLHSGNIGNTSIVWLTDLGAICMILLSFSGIWMWVNIIIRKGRRKNNE